MTANPVNRVSNEDLLADDGLAATLQPAERDALEAAGIDPAAVTGRDLSYRRLLDAGVDEDVADALRRRLSLPWSFDADGDLDRRSAEVTGLGEAEREWVARSADEEWQGFEAARSNLEADDDGPDERPYPRPTPVTRVTGVGPSDADRLAEGGVRSAECLARIDAFEVARALDLNVLHVRTWRHNARELLE